MAHAPVGLGTSFNTSTSSAQSTAFSVQTDTLRVVALTANSHVAIGTNPTATESNYFIPAGGSATIALTPGSQRIIGVSTGTTTTIVFPEGTGCPFVVDDCVTISGVTGETGFNTSHTRVVSVDTTANVNGYYSTRMTIAHDSLSLTAANAVFANAEARKSLKVAARTDTGTGKLYIQQVQISGQA